MLRGRRAPANRLATLQLLSTLDALLDLEMEAALDALPLSREIMGALLSDCYLEAVSWAERAAAALAAPA